MKTTLLLLLIFSTRVLGIDLVVPLSGPSATDAPFAFDSRRYQQVYGAGAFSSLTPVGGGWITAIAFRIEGGLFPVNPGAFQIDLSTTSRAVDGLSTAFASNVGSDNQTVFGPSSYYPQQGSPPFFFPLGMQIPLTAPFFYNPAGGNLLMDVRMFGGFGAGPPGLTYELATSPADESSVVVGSDRESLTGFAGTIGLVTGFRIDAIPEPSLVALAAMALLTTFIFGPRKKQPNRKE